MSDNFKNILSYVAMALPLISIFFAIKNRNRTIEREKAPTILKRNRKGILIIAAVFSLLLLYTHFQVYPALDNVYKSFNHSTPILLKIAPYSTPVAIIIFIILALYGYFSKSVEREFQDNLKKYQGEEKIKIRNLSGKRFNFLIYSMSWLWFLVFAVFSLLLGFQIITMAQSLR